MLLVKFVVFATLIAGSRLSKIAFEVNESDGFAEIEEAAIKLLTTCFGNRDKPVVLLGEFLGTFVERLMSNMTLSVVLLYDRRRVDNNSFEPAMLDYLKRHKARVVVITASHYGRNPSLSFMINRSHYAHPKAYYLMISWSKERHFGLRSDVLRHLYNLNINHLMNGNVMVHDRRKGVVLYTSNPFTNKAPEPWKLVQSFSIQRRNFLSWSYFVREHRENEDICKNLEFSREHDVGGVPIPLLMRGSLMRLVTQSGIVPQYDRKHRRLTIWWSKIINPIVNFVQNVNGTPKYLGFGSGVGENGVYTSIDTRATLLRDVNQLDTVSYPHGTACQHIVTQFRGNKSQLRKLYDIIDGYSWIGMCIVYLITLIFIKFFMRLPLVAGLLNLLRLTCNVGLPATPSSHSSRIYLGCLLFFVVTMQGIFMGNLASLLTHDIPVRQVNSLQDSIEFDYTLSILERDLLYVDVPTHRGHLHFKFHETSDECLHIVSIGLKNACLCSNEPTINEAMDLGFHVSPCLTTELLVYALPWRFFLEDEFNKNMRNKFEGATLLPFGFMVDEERMLERDAEVASAPLEPEVMTFEDLRFAFVILACGLSCAAVTFVAELITQR